MLFINNIVLCSKDETNEGRSSKMKHWVKIALMSLDKELYWRKFFDFFGTTDVNRPSKK